MFLHTDVQRMPLTSFYISLLELHGLALQLFVCKKNLYLAFPDFENETLTLMLNLYSFATRSLKFWIICCLLVGSFTVTVQKTQAQVTCTILSKDTVICRPYLLIDSFVSVVPPLPNPVYSWQLTLSGVGVVATSSVKGFAYIINTPGLYQLTAGVTGSNGQSCTKTVSNILVRDTPTVNFSVTPLESCLPHTIAINCNVGIVGGSLAQTIFQPSCGQPVTTQSACPASYTFPTICPDGCYDLTLIATDNAGCVGRQKLLNATCKVPTPAACLTADNTTQNCSTAPLTTNFTVCNPSASPLVRYRILINNVVVKDDTSKTYQHVFAVSPDCYDVKIVAYHPSGCADSVTYPAMICNRPQPTTAFTSSATAFCASASKPGCVTFTDNTPGGANAQHQWTFTPGGTPQNTINATYCVSNQGTFTITHTVTFAPGCSNTSSQQIVSNLRPTANFDSPDTVGCKVPFTVQLNDLSACAGCTYNWSSSGFPPFNPSNTAQNPQVTYANFGNYNVTQRVTAANGCSDTLVKSLFIKLRKIQPVIGFNKSKGCGPLCVTFTNLTPLANIPAGDAISTIRWIFPDSSNQSINGSPATKCFNNPGCNDVWLAMSTVNGCVDTTKLKDTICVGAKPTCGVTVQPSTLCYETDTAFFTVTCTDTINFLNVDFLGDGNWESYPVSGGTIATFEKVYNAIGNFTTKVVMYRDSCASDTVLLPIIVNPPKAQYSFNVPCGASTDSVLLINESERFKTLNWVLGCTGDTIPANGNLKALIPACLPCPITLIAYNDTFNCTHKYTDTVVGPCINSTFTPLDTTICVNRSVTFTNLTPNSTSTSWTFFRGPGCTISGGTLTGNTVTRLFNNTSQGRWCVRMISTNSSGCIDTVWGDVYVCKPTADFTANVACLPDSTYFTNLSSDTTNCTFSSVLWNFGSTTGATSTAFSPSFQYLTQGVKNVTLTVTTAPGCNASVTKPVTVGAPLNLLYSIDTLFCPGQSRCVTNTTTTSGVSYLWTCTGAVPPSSVSAQPCFSFPTAGDYTLVVEAQVGTGAACTKIDSIRIHVQLPLASGVVSDDTLTCPTPPQVLTFNSTAQYVDDNSTWNWYFGDGDESTLKDPTHIYNQPGEYIVSMNVCNNGCCDSSVIDTIVVLGPSGYFSLEPAPYVCACSDSVTYNVCTIKASNLALLSGCSLFTPLYNINPIGSEANPTCITVSFPYCITDSCLPQIVMGDGAGCQVYIDSGYLYIDSPAVQFTFDNYGVCVNGTVCFEDITSYNLPSNHSYTVNRYWDFGDGSPIDSSQNPSPCHYYATVGGYNVKLYIESNHGCIDSSVGTVVVVPEFPIAGYYADDSLICQFAPICFYDTSWIYPLTGADYWIWYWGDGSTDTIQGVPSACHSYDTGGYYRVTMCVFDSVGCPDCDSSIVIRVIDNPKADAGGDRFVCCGVTTTINGSGGTTYQWEPAGLFSNPTIATPTVTICYDTLITLYVGDQYGCNDTDYAMLTHSQIFAAFSTGTSYCLEDSVCVTDLSTNTNGTTAIWNYNFGDNTTYNTSYACHYYSNAGSSYNVSLHVTNNHGCVDSTFTTITVLPSPDAIFSLNDSVICSYEQICATNLSTSTIPITNTVFTYGDGFTTTGNGPHCHTYTPPYQAGYIVRLTVTDQNGCFDTMSIPVTLYEAPSANFNWTTSCETAPMPFNSTSLQGDGAINACQWTFWLGSPNPVIDNNCNTSYQFPAGNYPVQLVVVDVYGCADTVVKTVMSDSISQLVIYPGDTTICFGEVVTYSVSGVFDNIVWQPNVWIDDPNASTVTINPLANIGYTVSAVNGVCAAATSSFNVYVIQQIPFSVSATPDKIVLGLTSTITSQIPAPIDSIIWAPFNTLDCRDCPNPIAQPTQTTTYTATVYYSMNGKTCAIDDTVTITVLGSCEESIIFVPNTFTPNGDGLNDIFMIRGLAAVKINYFRVYDRWGKMVFEATDGAPNEIKWGWDGTDRGGEQLNPAVFVYTYEIECINGDTVSGKGNVTLVR